MIGCWEFLYNLTLKQENEIIKNIDALNELKNNFTNVLTSIKPLQGYFLEKIEIIKNKKNQANTLLLDNNKTVKKSVSNKSKIKPNKKGDLDLKNITYRLSDNRYIGRKQINGKIITVYGKTQKECYNNLKNAIKNVNRITKTTKDGKITLLQYFNKWYENDKAPFISKGAQNDILLVKKKLEPLHELPIENITKDIIIDFLKLQPDNRTKEKVILYFKACMKSAVLDKVIKDNPFNNLKTAPRKNISKPAFTYEQQVKILEILKNEEIRPIILIYLITGMRKNEFNFSSIEKDIDFETNILKCLNLKGRNLIKRYKYIKLSNSAISLIMNNLNIIHKYNSEQVYKKFADILKENNITGSIVTCRHTFATNCFYLGKPILITSREMVHSTTNLTPPLKIYADID